MAKYIYEYQTAPFDHQHEVFELSKDESGFAFLMEQGTGKTKPLIDTAAYLFETDQIDSVVVVGPSESDVPYNWLDQLEVHLPLRSPCMAVRWRSNMKAKERKDWERMNLAAGERVLRVMTLNIEAIRKGAKGWGAIKKFLRDWGKKGRSIFIVDESTRIAGWASAQTQAAVSLGLLSGYRRIATGTLASSPYQVFSQFYFLDPNILEFTSYAAYKAFYSKMLPPENGLVKHIAEKLGKGNADRAAKLQAHMAIPERDKNGHVIYKNLDILAAKIAPYSYRKLKSECLDLPPKLYEKAFVDLTPLQRSIYEQVKKEVVAEFEIDMKAHRLTVTMAMTRLRRLLQVLGNHVAVDNATLFDPDEEYLPSNKRKLERIENSTFKDDGSIIVANPRMAALLAIIDGGEPETKTIIWTYHRAELQEIIDHLEHRKPGSTLQLHGGVKDKRAARIAFQNDPKFTDIVCQVKAGIGVDLFAATREIFYTNDPSLDNRLQAEDRAHRAGQTKNVTIWDIIAHDTRDRWLVDLLRHNKQISEAIMQDDPLTWL